MVSEAGNEPGPVDQPTCSAKGCTKDAVVDLRWNNPKIHTPERRKSSVACAGHDAHLSQFQSARGFLREKEPLT